MYIEDLVPSMTTVADSPGRWASSTLTAPACESLVDLALENAALEPFNITVMNVDSFIARTGAGQVSSLLVTEPSSSDYHPEGLWSEHVFGQIGSPDRLTRFGYIELNTAIIAPVVYKAVIKISALYEEICKGTTYAVFNQVTKNFESIAGNPLDTPEADTGFSFFLKHFPEIDFTLTESLVRENRVDLINKYRDTCIYKRYIVQPAGLRDIKLQGSRMIYDEINDFYKSMLSYSKAIPKGATSPIYDTIRYSLQVKALEIYEYLENLMTGKRGFLQGEYGSRRLAMGTRNVISAADYAALTPDDPQLIKLDETKVGLYQTAKGLQPFVIHGIKTALVDPVFGSGDSSIIPVIDPDTLSLVYTEIPYKEKSQFLTSKKIEGWLNRFKNKDVRESPITIKDVTGKIHWLCMIYDIGDEIYLFRSIEDLTSHYTKQIDRSKIRPLTWGELVYLVTAGVAKGRHVQVTRYPVLQAGSTYISKIHVMTTTDARVVKLKDLVSDHVSQEYPQYPTLRGRDRTEWVDVVFMSHARLASMGADHDGDTVSVNFIWSDEANNQCIDYLKSTANYLDAQKFLTSGGSTKLIGLMMFNMTRDPVP